MTVSNIIYVNSFISPPKMEAHASLEGGLSRAKVQRYATYFFSGSMAIAGTALIGLALAGTISWPFVFLAIPLYTGVGALLYSGSSIIDYDDPNELEQIRQEASQMSLTEVTQKHGWNRLFSYGILSPTQFQSAYRTQADQIKLNKLFSFYERACAEYARAQTVGSPILSYVIPNPSDWKGKFVIETENSEWDEIIHLFPFERLKRYEILPSEELDFFETSLRSYHQAESKFELAKSQVERVFHESTAVARKTRDSAIDEAEQVYHKHPDHAQLEEINRDYQESLAFHYQRIDDRISRERAYLDGAERMHQEHTGDSSTNHSSIRLNEIREKYRRERREASREKSEIFFALTQKRDQKRGLCETRLHKERVQRDEKIQRANNDFDRDTKPERIQRDESLRPHQVEWNKVKAEINRAYQKIRPS